MTKRINKHRRRLIAGMAVGTGFLGVGGLSWAAHLVAMPDYSRAGYAPWQIQPVDMDDKLFVIGCGTLAASPHNTQPWRFHIEGDLVSVYADHQRHIGEADPEYRLMLQGVGCAIENIIVAAGAVGYKVGLEVVADQRFEQDGLCAILKLQHIGETGETTKQPRYFALFDRRTNRLPYDPDSRLPKGFQERLLQSQVTAHGVDITFLETPRATAPVDEIVRHSVRAYLSDGSRHIGGMEYFRLSREELARKRDGISLYTSDALAIVKAWANWLADRDILYSQAFIQGEIGMVEQTCTNVPIWALVHGDSQSPTRWLEAGRLLERLYLDATSEGLSACPIAYPTELPATRRMLRSAFGLAQGREPLALVRLGIGGAVERSVRRPIADVITV